MRLSKLVGLAVVLVAMAVVVNALAFKSAQVTNAMTITVDTSANAKLAIAAPTSADAGVTPGTTANGKYTLTINDKMQADSIYTFQNVFKMTNGEAAIATISCSINSFDPAISVRLLDNASLDAVLCSSGLGGATGTLAGGGVAEVKLEVTVGSGVALGAALGSLTITATR